VERASTVDLLAQAKQGSDAALGLLYERCAGRLLAYIRLRMGRDLRARLESRDILQSTLLKSLTHLHELKGEQSESLMAWLARIAEYEIRDRVDYHQRQRRDAAREVAIEDESPLAVKARSALSQVILNEEIIRLEAALETLSPAHRDIILLRKFEELTFPEIAKRLGKSEDACRMLFARAMTSLTLAMDGDR
jgi:RNA polymerase sigma-70 factor, ECF subfamily